MMTTMTSLALALHLLAGPPELPPELPPEPPPEPVAETAPIEVRAPEQVQSDAERGAAALPTPEQVRDNAGERPTSAGGDPFAPPPNPKAHPSEGVYAVGSGPIAPLPAPPPPVPISTIPKLDWRGTAWLSFRLTVTGPIGGAYPAKPSVVSLGGAVEGGWRINQLVGVGIGLARQPNEIIRQTVLDQTVVRRGNMNVWDFAFVRLFAPVRGRVDPFVDLGGGMVFLESARPGLPLDVGGSLRASVGFDAWLTKTITLGISGLYRAVFVGDSIGHTIQGAVELAVHF